MVIWMLLPFCKTFSTQGTADALRSPSALRIVGDTLLPPSPSVQPTETPVQAAEGASGTLVDPNSPFAHADAVALALPPELSRDIRAISDYMKMNLKSERDLVRAFYVWISRNIQYNVYNTFVSRNEEYSEEKDIQQTLDNRIGTCKQYSLLFRTLCDMSGIEAYIIDGYNKNEKGKLLGTAHQWCSARIDGQWYMFDVTWGAGYVLDYTFVPDPNTRYFMISTDTLMKTHMPFDPMWQMREIPISYQEFDTGVPEEVPNQPVFFWEDSLRIYANQTQLERLESLNGRILTYQQRNPLVSNALLLTQANIRTLGIQRIITAFESAMDLQDRAADSINIFIRYRNTTFEPLLPDEDIWKMVTIPENMVRRADSIINTIRVVPQNYHANILQLKEAIINLSTRIYKERLFLQQYFATPENKRKTVFIR